jgi:DNA-binding GntR family transcriptional regulator
VARRVRRTNGPLDLREQAILRAVIEEYVASASPVGSLALVERYGLGVSSATVRSILAELEAAGYLSHPHTSAGRVRPISVIATTSRRWSRRRRSRRSSSS